MRHKSSNLNLQAPRAKAGFDSQTKTRREIRQYGAAGRKILPCWDCGHQTVSALEKIACYKRYISAIFKAAWRVTAKLNEIVQYTACSYVAFIKLSLSRYLCNSHVALDKPELWTPGFFFTGGKCAYKFLWGLSTPPRRSAFRQGDCSKFGRNFKYGARDDVHSRCPVPRILNVFGSVLARAHAPRIEARGWRNVENVSTLTFFFSGKCSTPPPPPA